MAFEGSDHVNEFAEPSFSGAKVVLPRRARSREQQRRACERPTWTKPKTGEFSLSCLKHQFAFAARGYRCVVEVSPTRFLFTCDDWLSVFTPTHTFTRNS